MKNYEVLELAETLSAYVNELKLLKGAKFGYSIIKNIDLISKEAKTIQDVQLINEDFKKFEQARIDLCEKYANKDEKGKAKRIYKSKNNYEYDLDKNNSDFVNEYTQLQNNYSEAIKIQEDNFKEYHSFLNEDNSIELIKFSFDIVPEDISIELLSVIKVFIAD